MVVWYACIDYQHPWYFLTTLHWLMLIVNAGVPHNCGC